MVAPYTAADLIRVMEHEMHHRHQAAARRRSWLRRGGKPEDGNEAAARAETDGQRGPRPDEIVRFSLLRKPAS